MRCRGAEILYENLGNGAVCCFDDFRSPEVAGRLRLQCTSVARRVHTRHHRAICQFRLFCLRVGAVAALMP